MAIKPEEAVEWLAGLGEAKRVIEAWFEAKRWLGLLGWSRVTWR